MKKLLIGFIVTLFFAAQVLALDITFTIPNAQVVRVKDAMLKLHPNTETKADPLGTIDPGTGEIMQVPKWTDAQWVKELIRRYVVNTIRRAEEIKAKEQAAEGMLKDQNNLVE